MLGVAPHHDEQAWMSPSMANGHFPPKLFSNHPKETMDRSTVTAFFSSQTRVPTSPCSSPGSCATRGAQRAQLHTRSHLLGGDVEVRSVGQSHLGESTEVTAVFPRCHWHPRGAAGRAGTAPTSTWARTHLEAAPILLHKVVIHSAHRPPVLIQHLRLHTGNAPSAGRSRTHGRLSMGTPRDLPSPPNPGLADHRPSGPLPDAY